MAFGKKKIEQAPYETLSDLAIGSLGVFLILVVVLVVISSLHSSGTSDVFEKINNENIYYESEIIKAKKESSSYRSNDYAKKEIRQLRKKYDKTKRKLDRTIERLDLEKEKLQSNKAKFEEVTSVLDVIDQKKKEHADFVVETEKLQVQLKSLIDKQTGVGVDRTGRPHIEYSLLWNSDIREGGYYGDNIDIGLNSSFFMIGDNIFTKEQFVAILNSIHHEGDVSFTAIYKKANYSNSYSRACFCTDDWCDKWLREQTGWVCKDNIKIKDGYQ